MDQRDYLDLVGNVLRTAEGKKLVAGALDTAVVTCQTVTGGTPPQQSQDRPSSFELRAHAIYSVRERGENDGRKLLFDFVNQPRETIDAYKARHSVRNGIDQTNWRIYPGEAVFVGVGVSFTTTLGQLFTPTIEVASSLRFTYYDYDPKTPSQAVVLLVNDRDEDFLLHKNQLLGYVEFLRTTTQVRLNVVGEEDE